MTAEKGFTIGGALSDWAASLTQMLDGPASVFWWPSLLLAAGAAGWFLWREPPGRVDWRAYLREAPVDAGLFLAGSVLPFLLTPWLIALSQTGGRVGAWMGGGVVETATAPGWPALLACAALGFIAGDFALYWTHRLFHAVPFLWRMHRMHHAPSVLTPLTAFRFWPWEQVVHMSVNIVAQGLGFGLAAAMFGNKVVPLDLLGVNIFTLVWGTLFTHLRHSPVPLRYPRFLSLVLVSPHMHQLHHSADPAHVDRNFATVFAFWDALFGTLILPRRGERFRFGLVAPVIPAPPSAAAGLPPVPDRPAAPPATGSAAAAPRS